MHCNRIRSAAALLLLLAVAMVALSGCGGGGGGAIPEPITIVDDPRSPRAWTVLVYMAADNSLETYGIQDINEMESIGSTSQVAVLVQIDRKEGGDASNGDWTSTRRYRVTRDADESLISSELVADLGELNMAAPATLTDFVQWGVQNYPAQHYLLVLWDHGQGWQTRTLTTRPREVRAIHQDASSGMDEMSLPELEQALAPLPRMDVVLFDACLMGMIEVAYSIADRADIMAASEEEIPLKGQPYQSLVGRLVYNPGMDPRTIASAAVNDYVNYYWGQGEPCTLSAQDLTRLRDLASATDGLAAAMIADLGACRPAIRTAAENAQHYDSDSVGQSSYSDYRDLYAFAAKVSESAPSVPVRTAASHVVSVIDSFVIAQRNTGGSVAGSRGVSIYLPTPDTRTGQLLNQYAGISFGRDTRWDEFLAAY